MAWVAVNQANSGTSVIGVLWTNQQLLRSHWIGATGPSTPAEGDIWLDTSGSPYILKVYGDWAGAGAAWHEIAVAGELSSDMECSFQQLKEARVENLGAAEAVGAGKDGHVYYLTTDGELYFVDNAVDTVIKKLCSVVAGTTVDRVHLPLSDAWLDATNPPTLKTKGTTPTIRGWEFDATNELMVFAIRVPDNFSGDGDLTLKLACVLDQAEGAGDDIDWSADVIVAGNTDPVGGTSTAAAASLTDIGTDNADGDLHVCNITIDYDDATNPVAAGKWLFIEIHRTNLTEVGGVVLVGAHLEYPCDGAVQ